MCCFLMRGEIGAEGVAGRARSHLRSVASLGTTHEKRSFHSALSPGVDVLDQLFAAGFQNREGMM